MRLNFLATSLLFSTVAIASSDVPSSMLTHPLTQALIIFFLVVGVFKGLANNALHTILELSAWSVAIVFALVIPVIIFAKTDVGSVLIFPIWIFLMWVGYKLAMYIHPGEEGEGEDEKT